MEPKVSPVLNNCALHALTPEIKQIVLEIAANNGSINPLYDKHYEQLKAAFIKFYDLDAELSWQEFANILQRYNAFDIQIILAPVLRNLLMPITAHLQSFRNLMELMSEEYGSFESFTKIQKDPYRYKPLAADMVGRVLGNQLGIELYQHSMDPSTKEENILSLSDELKGKPLVVVQLYHNGKEGSAAHWERTDNEQDMHDFSKDEDTQLLEITKLFDDANDVAFDLLKQHIQLTHQVVNKGENKDAEFMQGIMTALQIEKYSRYLDVISPDNLLHLLEIIPNTTEQTKDFIAKYKVNNTLLYGELNAYCSSYFYPSTKKLSEGVPLEFIELLKEVPIPNIHKFTVESKQEIEVSNSGVATTIDHDVPISEVIVASTTITDSEAAAISTSTTTKSDPESVITATSNIASEPMSLSGLESVITASPNTVSEPTSISELESVITAAPNTVSDLTSISELESVITTVSNADLKPDSVSEPASITTTVTEDVPSTTVSETPSMSSTTSIETEEFLDKEKVQAHEINFQSKLDSIKIEIDKLIDKGTEGNENYDPEYKTVALKAGDLYTGLKNAAEFFYKIEKPTKNDFYKFKSMCKTTIETAEEEFKKHRGKWGKLPRLIRAIIGLFTIPISIFMPKTFFGNPDTKSNQKLLELKQDLQQADSDLENKGP